MGVKHTLCTMLVHECFLCGTTVTQVRLYLTLFSLVLVLDHILTKQACCVEEINYSQVQFYLEVEPSNSKVRFDHEV